MKQASVSVLFAVSSIEPRCSYVLSMSAKWLVVKATVYQPTVGRITYIVLVQTLNHAQSINQPIGWEIVCNVLILVSFVKISVQLQYPAILVCR